MSLPREKQVYLDWLLTPKKEREPSTQAELAEKLLVHPSTLSTWRRDKDFLEEWDKRYLLTIGNPDRKKSIMDTLYKTATDELDPKHVQAAKTYFEIEGSLRPAKTDINVNVGDASSLSREQLESLLAEHARKQLKVVDG